MEEAVNLSIQEEIPSGLEAVLEGRFEHSQSIRAHWNRRREEWMEEEVGGGRGEREEGQK